VGDLGRSYGGAQMREAFNFFVIAMFLFVLCVGYIYSQGGSPFALAGSIHVPTLQGDSVVGGPSLSASKIDSILSSAGSPAARLGNVFTLDSATYNIDDAVALAFFKHESTFGLYGAAARTHSLGNIVCTPGYSCIGRFRSYASWEEGITDWYKLISGPAYVGSGLSTVGQIIPKYAPSSDNNDESAYIQAVQSDVQTWRS
jgi:hypothetical protein